MNNEKNIRMSNSQFEIITESNIKINGLSNINESLRVHFLIYRIDNVENGRYYIGQHETLDPLDDYMGSGILVMKAVAKYGVEKFVKTILFDFDNFDKMNEKEKELVSLSNCYPNDPLSYNLKEGGSNGRLSDESLSKMVNTWHKTRDSKTLNERKELSKKYSDGTKKMWKKQGFRQKWHKTVNNRTQKQKEERNIKYANTIKNRTAEQQREISQKFSILNSQHYIDNPNLAKEHSIRMSGKGNPMYGHSVTEFMSEEKIREWKYKLSVSNSGENNPSFGKRWMHLKGSNKKEDRIYINGDQVQKYFELGYVLGLKDKK